MSEDRQPHADLVAFSDAIACMLLPLLMSRDTDAMVRWCKVRAWIDNALEGNAVQDLATIDIAVAYLAEQVANLSAGTRPRPSMR